MRLLITFLLTVTLFACSEKGNPIPVPDFSGCNCGPFYEPVCGVDGRSYLNPCLAECVGIKLADANGNCDSSLIVLNDTLTWPIQAICIPIQTPDDPVELSTLSDGSVIYKSSDGTIFRGNQNLCRCLPPTACIDAPGGGIELQKLSKGDYIFSLDEQGREIVVPVLDLQRVSVGEEHRLIKLIMSDGGSIVGSAMHPLADGRLLEELESGDMIEGREVKKREWYKNEYSFTMDLLPEGPTAVYRIDGYWYKTTMRQINM